MKIYILLTAENEMKPETIHPRLGTWRFYAADEIADFARDNNMSMRGQADHDFLLERMRDIKIFLKC